MRLYVHLSTTRRHGGSYQYEQNVLAALTRQAVSGWDIVVGYEDLSWKEQIPTGVTSFHVPRPTWFDYLFKPPMILRMPITAMRACFRASHPLCSILRREALAGCFFPSQECQFSYLVEQPAIGVIHDLMHRYESNFPEAASGFRRRYRDRHFELVAHCALSVLVDSELGKTHVQACYGPNCAPLDVLPFAVPRYADSDLEPDDFKARIRLPERFLFYPANLWKHKNHVVLLKAVYSLTPEIPDLQIVLSGCGGNAERDVLRDISSLGLSKRVHHLGYVEDAYMAGIYRRARALLMPTYFGPTNIPPLEAMRHGCPVIVSDHYAMPEQVGRAGLTFDPTSATALAAAIRRIWNDDDLFKQLAAEGRSQEARYGIRGFAHQLVTILRNRFHKVFDQAEKCE